MRAIVRIHRSLPGKSASAKQSKSSPAQRNNSSSGQGSNSSSLSLYIAWDDVDPEREGDGPRPLFTNAGHDDLSHYGADRYLTGGPKALAKDEIIHMSVSFRRNDFDGLGETDDERLRCLRSVTREAMDEYLQRLRKRDRRLRGHWYNPKRKGSEAKFKWFAGIHLNTPNPHVHIAIYKKVLEIGGADGSVREHRISKIPKDHLAPGRKIRDENPHLDRLGVIGRCFVDALDRAKERTRAELLERSVLEMGQSGFSMGLEFPIPLVHQGIEYKSMQAFYAAMKVTDFAPGLRRLIALLPSDAAEEVGVILDKLREPALKLEKELSLGKLWRSSPPKKQMCSLAPMRQLRPLAEAPALSIIRSLISLPTSVEFNSVFGPERYWGRRFDKERLRIIAHLPEDVKPLFRLRIVRTSWEAIADQVLLTALNHKLVTDDKFRTQLLFTDPESLHDGGAGGRVGKMLMIVQRKAREMWEGRTDGALDRLDAKTRGYVVEKVFPTITKLIESGESREEIISAVSERLDYALSPEDGASIENWEKSAIVDFLQFEVDRKLYPDRALRLAENLPLKEAREFARKLILADFDSSVDPRLLGQVSIYDDDYRTRLEQADYLGSISQDLRERYERGESNYDYARVIPIEEHEAPDKGDQFKVNQLSYAYDKIASPRLAVLCHKYFMMIAGEDAGPGAEIDICKHYYDRIEVELALLWAMEQALGAGSQEERLLRAPIAKSFHDQVSEAVKVLFGPDPYPGKVWGICEYYCYQLGRDAEGQVLSPDDAVGRAEALERTVKEVKEAIEIRRTPKMALIESVSQGRPIDKNDEDYERLNTEAVLRVMPEIRLYASEMAKQGTQCSVEVGAHIDDVSFAYRRIESPEKAEYFHGLVTELVEALYGPGPDPTKVREIFEGHYFQLGRDEDGHVLLLGDEDGLARAFDRTVEGLKAAIEIRQAPEVKWGDPSPHEQIDIPFHMVSDRRAVDPVERDVQRSVVTYKYALWMIGDDARAREYLRLVNVMAGVIDAPLVEKYLDGLLSPVDLAMRENELLKIRNEIALRFYESILFYERKPEEPISREEAVDRTLGLMRVKAGEITELREKAAEAEVGLEYSADIQPIRFDSFRALGEWYRNELGDGPEEDDREDIEIEGDDHEQYEGGGENEDYEYEVGLDDLDSPERGPQFEEMYGQAAAESYGYNTAVIKVPIEHNSLRFPESWGIGEKEEFVRRELPEIVFRLTRKPDAAAAAAEKKDQGWGDPLYDEKDKKGKVIRDGIISGIYRRSIYPPREEVLSRMTALEASSIKGGGVDAMLPHGGMAEPGLLSADELAEYRSTLLRLCVDERARLLSRHECLVTAKAPGKSQLFNSSVVEEFRRLWSGEGEGDVRGRSALKFDDDKRAHIIRESERLLTDNRDEIVRVFGPSLVGVSQRLGLVQSLIESFPSEQTPSTQSRRSPEMVVEIEAVRRTSDGGGPHPSPYSMKVVARSEDEAYECARGFFGDGALLRSVAFEGRDRVDDEDSRFYVGFSGEKGALRLPLSSVSVWNAVNNLVQSVSRDPLKLRAPSAKLELSTWKNGSLLIQGFTEEEYARQLEGMRLRRRAVYDLMWSPVVRDLRSNDREKEAFRRGAASLAEARTLNEVNLAADRIRRDPELIKKERWRLLNDVPDLFSHYTPGMRQAAKWWWPKSAERIKAFSDGTREMSPELVRLISAFFSVKSRDGENWVNAFLVSMRLPPKDMESPGARQVNTDFRIFDGFQALSSDEKNYLRNVTWAFREYLVSRPGLSLRMAASGQGLLTDPPRDSETLRIYLEAMPEIRARLFTRIQPKKRDDEGDAIRWRQEREAATRMASRQALGMIIPPQLQQEVLPPELERAVLVDPAGNERGLVDEFRNELRYLREVVQMRAWAANKAYKETRGNKRLELYAQEQIDEVYWQFAQVDGLRTRILEVCKGADLEKGHISIALEASGRSGQLIIEQELASKDVSNQLSPSTVILEEGSRMTDSQVDTTVKQFAAPAVHSDLALSGKAIGFAQVNPLISISDAQTGRVSQASRSSSSSVESSYNEYLSHAKNIREQLISERADGTLTKGQSREIRVRAFDLAWEKLRRRVFTDEPESLRLLTLSEALDAAIDRQRNEAQINAREAADRFNDFLRSVPELRAYIEQSNPDNTESIAKSSVDGQYFRGEIRKEVLDSLTESERDNFYLLKNGASEAMNRFKEGFQRIDEIRKSIRLVERSAYTSDKASSNAAAQKVGHARKMVAGESVSKRESNLNPEHRNDRMGLARVIGAEVRAMVASLEYEKALNHGDTFRFQVWDPSAGQIRNMSAHDVRERANAHGDQRAREMGLVRSDQRSYVKGAVLQKDLSEHSNVLQEHAGQLGNLTSALALSMRRALEEYQQAKQVADGILKKYPSDQIPQPLFGRKELNDLQYEAVKHGLPDYAQRLEMYRVAQAQELGERTRNPQEVGRLGAQKFVVETKLAACMKRRDSFDQACHYWKFPVKTEKSPSERLSLADIDQRIEVLDKNRPLIKWLGVAIDKSGNLSLSKSLAKDRDKMDQLLEMRAQVVDSINSTRRKMEGELNVNGRLHSVLARAYDREVDLLRQSAEPVPKSELTAGELNTAESNIEAARDKDLLQRLFLQHMGSDRHKGNRGQTNASARSSRGVAAAFMAWLSSDESQRRLDAFSDHGRGQRFLIRVGSDKAREGDSELITVRASDAMPRSLVDRGFHYLTESPDERKFRIALEGAYAACAKSLKAAAEADKQFFDATRRIAIAEVSRMAEENKGLAPVLDLNDRRKISVEKSAIKLPESERRLKEDLLSLSRGAKGYFDPETLAISISPESRQAPEPSRGQGGRGR